MTAAVESVGDSVARSLLPIVAVSTLGAGTATVGVLNSLGLVAFLVLSLPIGVLADRWSAPTRMMTTSTLVRAGVTGLGATAWLLGWLEGATGLAVLLLMALVVGVADVAYTSGQGLLVPRLVESDRIRSVFGRMQSAAQAGGAAGPIVLTALLVVVAAPLAWFSAAAMYLASALTQRGIRPGRSVPPAPRTSMWARAKGGAGHLLAQPVLSRITLANMLNNAAAMAANTLLPVIALSTLDLAPATYAAIGVVGALTGIAGAALAAPLTSRVGLRATRLATSAGTSLGVVLVMLAGVLTPALPGPPVLWLAAQAALAGGCTSIAIVAGSDLAPRLAPAEALGAVMGAQRALVLGIMPVAGVAIGALGAALGPAPTTWVWFVLAVASAIPCLSLRVPTGSLRPTADG